MALPAGDGSEPSSRAPVALPDFRLFDSAQDILDHNKRLIREIKANHDAQTPEALARNCLLIRELNTNIAAVMRAYTSIGDSFQAYMETQQAMEQQGGGGGGTANGSPGGAPDEAGPAVEAPLGAQDGADDELEPHSSRQGMEEVGGDDEEEEGEGGEQGGEAAVPDVMLTA